MGSLRVDDGGDAIWDPSVFPRCLPFSDPSLNLGLLYISVAAWLLGCDAERNYD